LVRKIDIVGLILTTTEINVVTLTIKFLYTNTERYTFQSKGVLTKSHLHKLI